MGVSPLTACHWIDGAWVDSAHRRDSIDPATGSVIGSYADGGVAEARLALDAAGSAFRDGAWRGDRRLRARALNEMADRFEARTNELVDILSLENGKIRADALFEVAMVPPKLRFYAARVLMESGRAVETAPGCYSTVLKEPMGVAGIIAPWNSPIVLFIRSLAPALAAGCTVVGKLPGQVAQTTARMCEVFAEVTSLPRGVLNVFSEPAHAIGLMDGLATHGPGVEALGLYGVIEALSVGGGRARGCRQGVRNAVGFCIAWSLSVAHQTGGTAPVLGHDFVDGRDAGYAHQAMDDVPARLENRIPLTTNGSKPIWMLWSARSARTSTTRC